MFNYLRTTLLRRVLTTKPGEIFLLNGEMISPDPEYVLAEQIVGLSPEEQDRMNECHTSALALVIELMSPSETFAEAGKR